MSNLMILTTLIAQRDEVFNKIIEIEASCGGIENENNAKRVQKLNLEHAQCLVQRQEISFRLAELDGKISSINAEITKLSVTGVDRILEAIKNQRWYFIKNKPQILFDKNTGLIWANLHWFSFPEFNYSTYRNHIDEKMKEFRNKFG